MHVPIDHNLSSQRFISTRLIDFNLIEDGLLLLLFCDHFQVTFLKVPAT